MTDLQTQFGGNFAAAGGQQLTLRAPGQVLPEPDPNVQRGAPGQFTIQGTAGPHLPSSIANRIDLGGPPVGGFPPGVAPPTGLIGAEQALLRGGQGATGAVLQGAFQGREDITGATQRAQQNILAGQQFIDAGAQEALGQIGQGAGVLGGFVQPGQQAFDLQAAQSGALGPEAQAAAFQAFRESPGQQFALEQAERASIRNASATGGLGGGNIRRELERQAIGFAQQDFANQFARLGQVSGLGAQAAGQTAQLRGQGAGILAGRGAQQAQLSQQAASIEQQTGINLGQIAQQTGLSVADIVSNISQGQAGLRTQAGRDIAAAISATSSGLAGLQQQQGAGISDIVGSQVSNIGNLLLNQGLSDAASQQQQAIILANISTGQGSVAANVASNIGNIQAASVLGRSSALSDGIAGIAGALGDTNFLRDLFKGGAA